VIYIKERRIFNNNKIPPKKNKPGLVWGMLLEIVAGGNGGGGQAVGKEVLVVVGCCI
jgi:hypothetical protein